MEINYLNVRIFAGTNSLKLIFTGTDFCSFTQIRDNKFFRNIYNSILGIFSQNLSDVTSNHYRSFGIVQKEFTPLKPEPWWISCMKKYSSMESTYWLRRICATRFSVLHQLFTQKDWFAPKIHMFLFVWRCQCANLATFLYPLRQRNWLSAQD